MIRHNKCFVPGCNSGCTLVAKPGSQDALNKKNFFTAPEDKKHLERWRRNIPKVGKYLIPGIFVCEVHFTPDSIERFQESVAADGRMTVTRRPIPVLKPNAVPTIFPNLPTSLVDTLKKIDAPCGLPPKVPLPRFKKPKELPTLIDITSSDSEKEEEMPVNDNAISSSHMDSENDLDSTKSKKSSQSKSSSDNRVSSSTHDSNTSTINQGEQIKEKAPLHSSTDSKTPPSSKKGSLDTPSTTTVSDSLESEMDSPVGSDGDGEVDKVSDSSVPLDEKFQILVTGFEDSNDEPFSFGKLKSDIYEITMPSPQWSFSCLNEAIAFIDWAWYYETRKKIIVTKNLMYRIFVRNKEIKVEGYEGPKSLKDVNEILRVVENIPICWGMGSERGWSKNCTGHVPYREGPEQNAAKRKCDACLEEIRMTPGVKRKQERKKQRVLKLASAFSSEKNKNKILYAMVQKLKRRNMFLSLKQSNSEGPRDNLKSVEMNDDVGLDEMIEFASPNCSDVELSGLEVDLPES